MKWFFSGFWKNTDYSYNSWKRENTWAESHVLPVFLPGYFSSCSTRKNSPRRWQQPSWAKKNNDLILELLCLLYPVSHSSREEGVAQRRSLRNLHNGPFWYLDEHRSVQCKTGLHKPRITVGMMRAEQRF